MTGCKVDQVALNAEEARQVTALINRSFPENPDVGTARIGENTEVGGDEPSIYVAAKIGSEIIGFNGFISHRLWLNGEPILAFQSCWTATSDQHRGKGIFQQLINAGREIVRSRGAAFLFGFPNPNSHPIFLHKLGFRERPSIQWRMPLLPFASTAWLDPSASIQTRDSVLQENASLIALKRRTHGNNLIEIRAGDSMMWGVKRKTARFGVPLAVFDIGGVELERTDDLQLLFKNLSRAARGCAAVQFVGVKGSSYLRLFRRQGEVEPPLIVDDVHLDTTELTFSFFSGIRDYY